MLGAVILAAAAPAAAQGQPSMQSHPALGCIQCHGNAAGGTLRATEKQICGTCHRVAVQASHPVNFTPKRPLPARFPLDGHGNMNCSTCHDIHSPFPGAMREGSNGIEFCTRCHDRSFFDAMADRGASLVRSGHLDARPPITGNLDNYSIACIGCHSEKATVVGAGGAAFVDPNHTNAGGNHPIGAEYRRAEDFGGYRPAGMLTEEIVLPRGRMSCVSCHVGYSAQHGRLSHTRSGLCYECHAI